MNGSVVSGPSCPVVSAESPCPDRPWQGTVRAVRPDGRPAGDARTTRQGDFLLTLPPGVYDIAPVTTGAASTRPQRVTVPPIGLITIHLTVDSGIR